MSGDFGGNSAGDGPDGEVLEETLTCGGAQVGTEAQMLGTKLGQALRAHVHPDGYSR